MQSRRMAFFATIDLYSLKEIGWAMDDKNMKELEIKGLNMATISRKTGSGLIWHSERSSQYASYERQGRLWENGVIASMSSKDNCRGNAVMEFFPQSMEIELLYGKGYSSKEKTKQLIFEYVLSSCNRKRLRSALGYQFAGENKKRRFVASFTVYARKGNQFFPSACRGNIRVESFCRCLECH